MANIKRTGELFPQLPSLFDDFFSRNWWDWNNSNFSATSTTIPAVNVIEKEDNFEVEMAAPGMDKKDFRIELDNNKLTISSAKNNEKEEEEKEIYYKREFSYQSFVRTFTFSKDVVDSDKIEAKYENGILHLTIPKREEAKSKPRRMTKIS